MMAIAVVLLSLCGSVVTALEKPTDFSSGRDKRSLRKDAVSERRLDTG